MGIVGAITGFFTALPDIVKLIKEASVWINHVSGNDPQGFVKRVGEAMTQLNQAKTDKERQDAAKSIADAINKL